MKIKEIKELTDSELLERLEAQRNNLVTMKMNHAISPLDNPQQIKEVRREIARFATELRQRELNKKD